MVRTEVNLGIDHCFGKVTIPMTIAELSRSQTQFSQKQPAPSASGAC